MQSGLDGFIFKFIKSYWDQLHGDILRFVQHFEKHGKVDEGCNSSFITLVPKIKDSLKLLDYRPICLIGCLYKSISKTLAHRIKSSIGMNIDEVQTTYVEGRNILDGPLIINELCS